MGACSPLRPVLFALVLQAARLAPAERTPTQDLIYRVGDTATLSLEVPQRSNISNLLWRSFSRRSGQVMATWSPENSLNILSASYTGRLRFLEDSWALEIHNLSKTDGGLYEVVEMGNPSELLLKTYTLVVFRIITTAQKTANGSCSVTLLCEAGAGVKNQVEYSWGPSHEGPVLRLTLHPANQHKSYICTATVLGTRYSHEVAPYEACSSATRAAGLLGAPPALLLALLLRRLLL